MANDGADGAIGGASRARWCCLFGAGCGADEAVCAWAYCKDDGTGGIAVVQPAVLMVQAAKAVKTMG